MTFTLPKIYPITDTRISGLTHLEQVKRLVAGGARFVQLREKHASPTEFYEAAMEVMKFARENDIKVIINDRVDIALAANANGVHLGQSDLPPRQARQLLLPDMIIGFSTHSPSQALAAIQLPVDYIGYGPVFPTTTKQDPDTVVGVEGLMAIRQLIGDFPLVAIGGIGDENLKSVFEAGADSAAIVSEILSDPAKIQVKFTHLNRM